MAMTIEVNLRAMISDILTPFHDRFNSLTREVKNVTGTCDNNVAQLILLNGKLDRE